MTKKKPSAFKVAPFGKSVRQSLRSDGMTFISGSSSTMSIEQYNTKHKNVEGNLRIVQVHVYLKCCSKKQIIPFLLYNLKTKIQWANTKVHFMCLLFACLLKAIVVANPGFANGIPGDEEYQLSTLHKSKHHSNALKASFQTDSIDCIVWYCVLLCISKVCQSYRQNVQMSKW